MRGVILGGVLVAAGFLWGGSGMAAAEPPVPVQVKRVLLVNDAPAVLLLDHEGTKFLLVFIDFFMANAIQTGMRQPQLERPLTHDLMGILLHMVGARLTRIDITELKNNTYYSLITLQVNGRTQQVDSRPSDALALAVRNQVPVFVNPALLKLVKDSMEPPAPGGEATPNPDPKTRGST